MGENQLANNPGLARLYELYQEQRKPLLAFLYGMTSNPDDSEDLLQDTFRKAHEYIIKSPNMAELTKAWLFKIAYNETLNTLDRRRRYDAKLKVVFNESAQIVDDTAILDALSLDEIFKFVKKQYDARQQALFQLRFGNNLSVTETAEAAGLSVSQASRILSRMITEIQTNLAKK